VLLHFEFNAIIHREIQNQPAPLYMNDWAKLSAFFFMMNFRILEMQWQNLIPLIDNATRED
jgi:hypothetical protein